MECSNLDKLEISPNDIPAEVMLEIFGYLSVESLCACAQGSLI